MAPKRYAALLRGINVGGRNPVSMADLREAFETEGYNAVSTYTQSGNVLFESDASGDSLENELEGMLERRLGFHWSSCCGHTASFTTSSTRLRTGSVGHPTRITRM